MVNSNRGDYTLTNKGKRGREGFYFYFGFNLASIQHVPHISAIYLDFETKSYC